MGKAVAQTLGENGMPILVNDVEKSGQTADGFSSACMSCAPGAALSYRLAEGRP